MESAAAYGQILVKVFCAPPALGSHRECEAP